MPFDQQPVSLRRELRAIFNRGTLAAWARRRWPIMVAVFAIEAALVLAFSNLPSSPSEMQTYATSWNHTATYINSLSPPMQVASIFENNGRIALNLVGPVVGQFTFLSANYNTARILDVIAARSSGSPNLVLLGLYLYPHTWIETFAYAVASGEGLYLMWEAVKGRIRSFDIGRIERELPYVLLSLAAAGVLLAVAALFEVGEALVGGYFGLLFWIPFALLLGTAVWSIRRAMAAAPQPPLGRVLPSPTADVVRLDIEARVKTDRPISSVWIALPGFAFVLALSFGVYVVIVAVRSAFQSAGSSQPLAGSLLPFGFLGYFPLVPYGILAVLLVLVYKLIKRRNGHFKRQQALFGDLLALLGAESAAKTMGAEFQARVGPAQSTVDEIRAKETQRETLLWVIACFFVAELLPFVIYFLMKDYYNHEKREERFLQQVSLAASSAGFDFPYFGRTRPLPNRSFAVYTVLTLVTYGLFAMYWLYRLVDDPNEHFESQWDIEDRLYGDLSQSVGNPSLS